MTVSRKGDTKSNGEEITLQMVMSHMQHGFSRVHKKLDSMDLRMDSMEKRMNKGFADLQCRWGWMDSHELPKRVSRLEDKVFAGVDT